MVKAGPVLEEFFFQILCNQSRIIDSTLLPILTNYNHYKNNFPKRISNESHQRGHDRIAVTST